MSGSKIFTVSIIVACVIFAVAHAIITGSPVAIFILLGACAAVGLCFIIWKSIEKAGIPIVIVFLMYLVMFGGVSFAAWQIFHLQVSPWACVLIAIGAAALTMSVTTLWAFRKHPENGYVAVWVFPKLYYSTKKAQFFNKINQRIDVENSAPGRCFKKTLVQAQEMNKLVQVLPAGVWCITETNENVLAGIRKDKRLEYKVIYRSRLKWSLLSFLENNLYRSLFHGCDEQCPKYSKCPHTPHRTKQAMLVAFRKRQDTPITPLQKGTA